MATIKVFGHKAPDTDSTCSAISYAWYLNDVKKIGAQAFVLGDINKETEFVLKKFDHERPEKLSDPLKDDDKVVVVDTNNVDELPTNIENANIQELIDHHKLCLGISTEKPIPITIRAVACTATIIWQKMNEDSQIKLPKNIAGLMLAAIVSDTLNFTSPTTTEKDKEVADKLSAIAGEDIETLAEEMFDAKSNLTGMDAKNILLVDSKVYETNGKKVRYSVLETTSPDKALSMKEDLLTGMEKIKKEEGLDYMFFFAIDILKSEATLIVPTEEEKEIAEKAFSKKFDGDALLLPGVVSRKKQVIPSIEPVIG